ncbi:hypothetical protein CW712_01445 [Candidatus Bathyarchaeota archaeon]|nr:MAG: hypothetical protein CW712_01445 [Candidatus Bathyarchaeota archaeon]
MTSTLNVISHAFLTGDQKGDSMRSTPIGIVMFNDERGHLWKTNNRECTEVLQQWAEVIRKGAKNIDGALRQAGIRTHRIVGDIDDPETCAKVIDWVRASQAYTTIQNEVYGMYGGHSMDMETGYFHLVPIIKTFGVTTRQIDQLWLVKKMKEVDEEEGEKGFKWFEQLLGDRLKYDEKMLTPETLKNQIRLYLAMKMVNEEEGFDFCGLKG